MKEIIEARCEKCGRPVEVRNKAPKTHKPDYVVKPHTCTKDGKEWKS